MAGLPREVLRWLQSLDLTFTVKNAKWDFSNGFLIAEIYSWYYPREITMHSFHTGSSLQTKMANWYLLDKFFRNHGMDIPKELMLGTIHNKEGAALMLVQDIYERLTKKKVHSSVHDDAIVNPPTLDFTCSDQSYQMTLPMHARATASTAVKSNFQITEAMAHPNIITNAHQAQKIISNHLENRQRERMQDPDRFEITATLGETSVRQPTVELGEPSRPQADNAPESAPSSRGGIPVQEIQVRQHAATLA